MNICLKCNKFLACNKASEEITECKDYIKRSYDTKLVKVDGLNYKFERIE